MKANYSIEHMSPKDTLLGSRTYGRMLDAAVIYNYKQYNIVRTVYTYSSLISAYMSEYTVAVLKLKNIK